MVTILDYGMGNLRSVLKACEHLGHEARVQPNLDGATKVILPGVGAFAQAMQNLAPIADDLRAWASQGQPLLGICLGQQLLFESSEEFGESKGLGILGGHVKYFPKHLGLKTPQIGWNVLEPREGSGLMQRVAPQDRVYFVHSLYTDCADASDAAAWTEYGLRYPSAIERGAIWATQFHPEKSGHVGLTILENFLKCS